MIERVTSSLVNALIALVLLHYVFDAPWWGCCIAFWVLNLDDRVRYSK